MHEYPHYAVAKPGPGSPAIHLQEGMIITNEPGYYEEGLFGIRIENIMLIEKFKNSKEQLLSMRPLTLVPYCSKLIVKDLLEKSHKRAIQDYYKRIEDSINFDSFKSLKSIDRDNAKMYLERELSEAAKL